MIVNFKQQRIMKPIYNVWILLFCLTFSSCYNEDIINPTPDPLALAGGLMVESVVHQESSRIVSMTKWEHFILLL